MPWSNRLGSGDEPPGRRAAGELGPLMAAIGPCLVLALAAGCRSPDPGGSSGSAGTAAPAAPSAAARPSPPRAAASVAAHPLGLASGAPGGSPGPGAAPELAGAPAEERCAAGFTPSSDPSVDAARLGLLCGPSSGLSLLAAASGAVGEEGPTLPFRWEAEPGECFRVVAAAGEGALDVALTVELPGGGHLLAATGNRWAIVPADGLICPAAGRPLTLRVRTHAGRGRAALEIWRGRGLAAESLVPDPRAHPAAASSGAIPRVDAPPRTHSLH